MYLTRYKDAIGKVYSFLEQSYTRFQHSLMFSIVKICKSFHTGTVVIKRLDEEKGWTRKRRGKGKKGKKMETLCFSKYADDAAAWMMRTMCSSSHALETPVDKLIEGHAFAFCKLC